MCISLLVMFIFILVFGTFFSKCNTHPYYIAKRVHIQIFITKEINELTCSIVLCLNADFSV